MNATTTTIQEALSNTIRLQRIMSKYMNVPRSYGTEDVLYMREVHLIELLGDTGEMMSAEEIAASLEITHGAVTQLTDRLEKKDYVYRDKSRKDRRQILRGLTEKGQNMYRLHKQFDEEQFHFMIEQCADLTLEEFQIFNKVAQHLESCLANGLEK